MKYEWISPRSEPRAERSEARGLHSEESTNNVNFEPRKRGKTHHTSDRYDQFDYDVMKVH